MGKRIIATIFLLTFLIALIPNEADAQRTRRTRRTADDETSVPLSQKLYYSIHLGNLDFFNGNFSFSNKFSTGYKLNKRFSAGLSAKSFLDIYDFNGPNLNLFSYGAAAFARFKITNDIYIHGEYGLTSYEDFRGSINSAFRDTYTDPLIGLGYESGQGPWKFGLQLLFTLNSDVENLLTRDFGEYWISFSYNF